MFVWLNSSKTFLTYYVDLHLIILIVLRYYCVVLTVAPLLVGPYMYTVVEKQENINSWILFVNKS